jgi:hypothetical protein
MRPRQHLPFVVAAFIALCASAAVLMSPASAVAQECTGQQCRIQIPWSGQQFTQSCTTASNNGELLCKCNAGEAGSQNQVYIIWNNCPDGVLFH